MPALPLPASFDYSSAYAAATTSLSTPNSTSNQTIEQVICAWPVSGQYGPGTRILYYVLVAVCVLGRSYEWLRSACLAAALLLPAVAALHGIVLASIHVDGAVDMDIYGVFQLCAVAALAGPVTVRNSTTYFNTPGRNLIFIWAAIILAGLLSLTVEFLRTNTAPCPPSQFQYGLDNACNLTCSVTLGPFSPLRKGAQNNIYVIQAPQNLSFGAATLLAAGCCIPAVLSLISMWQKISKDNWMKRFGGGREDEPTKPSLSSLANARMSSVNARIGFYLSMIEIPVFGGAICAIIIVGERNFFSRQVDYMTEPIASVGQWAPIVGTGLAAVGSLYALLAQKLHDAAEPGADDADADDGNVSSLKSSSESGLRSEEVERRASAVGNNDGDGVELSEQTTYQSLAPRSTRRISAATTNALNKYTTTDTTGTTDSKGTDVGNRRRVARTLERLGRKLGTPAPGAFDDSPFKKGFAADFPTVPGEEARNPDLGKIKASYNPRRDPDGNATPLRKSFTGSVASGLGLSGGDDDGSGGGHRDDTMTPAVAAAGPRERRDTLEVPQQVTPHSPEPRRSLHFDGGEPDVHTASPTIKISHES